MFVVSHSRFVYASISRPDRLLLSTGSSLISTPGPTRREPDLCRGKTYSSKRLVQIWTARPTYLGLGPAEAEGNLVGEELSEAQHEAVNEGKEEVDGGATQETPYRGGMVEDQRRARGGRWI